MRKFNLNNLAKLLGACFMFAVFCADAPISGAYAAAITQYQLNNPAQDAVQTVNTILCVLTASQYSQHTNGGPQFIQVNQNDCEGSGNPGQQGSSSENSAVPKIMNITYNATRANTTTAPELVDIWIEANFGGGGQEGGGGVQDLNAHLVATATPTDTNPYGIFNFDFALFPHGQAGQESALMMSGYVNTSQLANGQTQLLYAETGKDGGSNKTQTNQVILIGNGITTGYGSVSMPNRQGDSGGVNSTITMAYNSNNLLTSTSDGAAADDVCYNRNSTHDFVYVYGVYDNSGDPVVIPNGGYQITYNGQRGWYGYYGIGLPSGAAPTNNTAITYANQDGSSPKEGTVVVKNGRMNSVSAKAFTLADLSGVPINVPQSFTNNGGGNNISDIISWDKATQSFNKVGTQTCNPQSGCITTATVPASPFGQTEFQSIAQISFNGGQGIGTVQFQFNGVGSSGNTQIQLFSGCTQEPPTNPNQGPGSVTCSTYISPTNTTAISVWSNNTVTPSSGSPTIYYCVQGCPYESNNQWSMANPQYDGSGGQFVGGQESGQNIPYITYSFDPESYTLTIADESAPAINGQAISLSGTENGQFIGSGPLLTQDQYTAISGGVDKVNYAALYDGTTVNPYLQWQTSNQSWSSYTGIKDSDGNYIPLSNPLQVVYTDTTTGGANFLQYAGEGNLQGIPGTCVDQDGSVVQCGPGTIWVPAFSIPDGSQLTTFGGNTSYWVRQLFVSQVLNKDTTGGCSSLSDELSTAEALTLPPLSDGWDPTSIGDKPTVVNNNN